MNKAACWHEQPRVFKSYLTPFTNSNHSHSAEALLVQEYYSRLRALRWQAISARAEEEDTEEQAEADNWHFQWKLQELAEGDMDVLSAECKAAGLSHLFKAALKLN